MPEETDPAPKRAPTLYAIIVMKLAKGALLLTAAIVAYTLSDNDLPAEFKSLLHNLGQDPQRKFFISLAKRIATVTEANVLWVAAATLGYSLFSLVEGIGLIFRIGWAGWLAVLEGAFFIPIEVYELLEKGFSWSVLIIMIINVFIVAYLIRNRERLFQHHHPHANQVKQPESLVR
jgi:uncharacterized membrane protein (DUF2068 family)